MLSKEEIARYARHFVLPEFGVAGQEALKRSSVLCVGAGGLGSPALLYLAAAGVGRIGVVDPDRVEASNLQRQIVHPMSSLGRWKVESAAETLRSINPFVQVETFPTLLTAANAEELIGRYDLVLDGCDNFATRYLTSDVGTWQKKANIYASIQHFEGQLSVFAPHLGGPCYRCLVPQPPAAGSVPTCAEGGVLGVLPGILGSLQATEAIKLLTGIGQPMIGRFLHVDTLQMSFREFRLKPDPACAVCGPTPTITRPVDYEAFCGNTCSATAAATISTKDFLTAWKGAGKSLPVIDVREVWETQISPFPEATVIPLAQLATVDVPFAKSTLLYVVCKAEHRSQEGAKQLRERGWDRATTILGGMDVLADLDDDFMPY
jgi:sulfur-carrier protein adenylyltransferase/sulfurtransferase